MKKNSIIRCLICLAAWMTLFAAGALSEESLSVDLRGLSLVEGGNWRSVALNAVFDVQDASGAHLGSVAANATQEQLQAGLDDHLALPEGTQIVRLIPQADTLPANYVFESQYEIRPADGGERAAILVYKAEGLFSLANTYPDGGALAGASFELTDGQGGVTASFNTDEQGSFILRDPIAAGVYSLRQTDLPVEALPAADQTITISAYKGEEIPHIIWVNEPAPLDQLDLSRLTAEIVEKKVSLYEGEQTFEVSLRGGVDGRNEWPLTNYQIVLADLALVDRENKPLNASETVYLSELKYQPGTTGYTLSVELTDARGTPVDGPILLNAGESLINRSTQAVGAVITYQNSRTGEQKAEPGFDGGSLAVQVTAAGRTPQADKPDAAAVTLTIENTYQLVYAGAGDPVTLTSPVDQAMVNLPVDETFALAADLHVNDQGIGELTLINTGARTLPAAQATLCLPAGWRLANGLEGRVIRMAESDYWVMDTQSLAPGQKMALDVSLAAFGPQGQASLYWKHTGESIATLSNPEGLFFGSRVKNPATDEISDGMFALAAAAGGECSYEADAPVSGCLFEDLNGNGRKDENESGQAGLGVEWSADHVTYKAVTDAQGVFVLAAAPAGDASLSVNLPEHMMLGAIQDDLMIPYTVTCRIAGQVLCGDTPMAGITVQTGDLTEVTDANGAYAFNRLVAGTYPVTFTLPEDMRADYGFAAGSFDTWQTEITVGDADKEASVDAQVERLGAVLLEAEGLDGREAVLMKDNAETARALFTGGRAMFMQVYPGDYQMSVVLPEGMMLAQLNGHETAQKDTAVWNLSVEGGQRAACQMTLAQLGSIDVVQSGSAAPALTLTDVNGTVIPPRAEGVRYVDLLPGQYLLTGAMPAGCLMEGDGWILTDGIMSCLITLAQGQQVRMELSVMKAGAVEGFLFEDDNGNSVKDGKEKGVKNVKVALYAAQSGTQIAECLTDSEGKYAFEGLLPGEYFLQIPVQKDAAFKQKAQGVVGADGKSSVLAVQEGERLTGQNGALVAPTSLKAAVFIDANEDGERGVYERVLEGAKVTLLNAAGETTAQGVTNKEGELRLTGLAPGMYRLQFEIPEGYAFGPRGAHENSHSSATDALDAQVAVTEEFELVQGKVRNIGCGIVRLGTVTGKVWYDVDADGVMGETEPGQSGVRIILTPRRAGGQTYETVTDETGIFLLDRVRAASYTLTAELPDGMMVTRYSATGGDRRSIFSTESQRKAGKIFVVKAGEVEDDLNIGVVTGAAIEGKVFLDPDYDGLYRQGDDAVAGVQVTLIRTSSGETVESVKTDETGAFCFDALRGAEYRLRVTLPEGNIVFTQTVDRSVTGNWVEARDSRISNLNDLELEDMERKTVMIGTVYTGSIAGSVYLDDNYSAARDSGEEKASGMKVRLVNEAGKTVAEDRVNSDGTYLLKDITPGAYQVHMDCAQGYVFTKQGEGNAFTSVNDDGDGVSRTITVAMGQQITGVDAGMVRPGQVKGMIFNDVNDNGLHDSQEGGLAGVTVTLINREDETTTQLVTGEDGMYSFNRVMPGEYYVHYALPEGGVFAREAADGNCLKGESDQAASEIFKFKTAEKKEMALGGALILSAVEGVAFNDVNGSGTMDEGEAPLAGLTLALGDISVVADTDGHFVIEGVRPGEYSFTLDCPEGFVFSRSSRTMTPRGEVSFEGIYQAEAGKRDTGMQIGMVRPATIAGSVWMDENLSALWEKDESMVSGQDVILRDLTDGETIFTCSTDETGAFIFTGMTPGRYEAYLELPAHCVAPGEGDSRFLDNGEGRLVYPAFDIAENETKDDLVAGLVRYTVIAGMTWLDQGGLVLPLAEVTVDLMGENDETLGTCITGEDGRYAFEQVLPGTYRLEAKLPGDYLLVSSQDDRVTSGDLMSVIDTDNGGSGTSHLFRVNMGEDETDMDIGAVKPGMLGDTVWLDENGNGLQDTGELPVKGVRIALMKDGETVAEAISDAYGYFLFTNVYPSHYDVLVEWHDELIPTRQRKDMDLLNSELAESEEISQVIQSVNVASDVKNFNFDLGFALRKKGVYPEEAAPAPTQVWK